MIAALYIDEKGVYPTLEGVDAWGVTRDARQYAGPHPVVAHPPCNLWVNFAALNFKRYGGAHNLPGNDGAMFAHALACVRQLGGVLEHPASSNAWRSFCLTRPQGEGWRRCGTAEDAWVCEVWQSAYGHKARKRTWLYCVSEWEPASLDWTRERGSHQCGWFDRAKPTLGKREASATPKRFAYALLGLAAAA